MLYASSKDALRRSLVGIASEIQGTDSSEVAYDEGASLSSRRLESCHADGSLLGQSSTRSRACRRKVQFL